MSNYFPPSNQPPQQPPMGFPPPQYGQPGYLPTRTSAAAVTSLICGVLGCFVITGIIAIITGIIGLSATSNPQVKGRGMAIAGILTGLLFGLGGGGCLVLGGWGYMFGSAEADKVVVVIDKALTAASNGDETTFNSCFSTSLDTPGDFVVTARRWGAPGKFDKDAGWDLKVVNGRQTLAVKGTVKFATAGDKRMLARGVKQTDGTYKLEVLTPE